MSVKCKIKMGDKCLPVPGSVQGAEGKESGTCPECQTPGVVLSIVGGYVRAHTVAPGEMLPENNPQPATLVEAPVKRQGKALSEPQVDNVSHTGEPGDPKAAMERRTVEIQGATESGTVMIPVKSGGKGRAKLTAVVATEANVRACLAYWVAKKPRKGQTVVPRQSETVSALTRRLEAMRAASVVVHAPLDAAVTTGVDVRQDAVHTSMGASASPEGHTRHVLTGPALVKGPNMAPVQKVWRNPATGERETAAARLDGALTERLDKTVADARPTARFTASQRSNYRRKQRRLAQQRSQG